ncbi:protein FAM200A [Trichonephila clavipes]|nr:protein FAM200A [Trichonephila clavipes]
MQMASLLSVFQSVISSMTTTFYQCVVPRFRSNRVGSRHVERLKTVRLPKTLRNEKALLTSYKVSYKKARRKKPHSMAEELILPAAIEIVETMFGDNFAKELQSIPLSNDTISRRIDDIAEDVEQQLFSKLRDK